MRTQLLPALLALASHVGAVKITSPAKNDVVDLSKGVTVQWSTVSTDPSRARLVLVNMAAGHTPFSKDLGEVDLSKGSFVVTEKDVPEDDTYQFNFEGVGSANTGILAQSEQFEVDNSGDSNDESSSSTAGSSTATTTGTATATGSTTGSSGSTTTPAPTTLTTVSSSTGSTTATQTGSTTRSTTTSTSTGGAVVGATIQSGSFLALLAGLAAFIA